MQPIYVTCHKSDWNVIQPNPFFLPSQTQQLTLVLIRMRNIADVIVPAMNKKLERRKMARSQSMA